MPRRTHLDEARDPATPPARLRQLAAARATPGLRLALASNPGAPADLLTGLAARLGSDRSGQLAATLASNPGAPTELLLTLAAKYPAQVLQNPVFGLLLMQDPQLLARAPGGACEALAQRPELPEFLLDGLAEGLSSVRHALLKNPSLPARLARRLAVDHDEYVRVVAVTHANLPPGWLALLRRAGATADLRGAGDPGEPALDDGEWGELLAEGRWAFELAARHPGLPPWAAERIAREGSGAAGLRAQVQLAGRADLPEAVALLQLDLHGSPTIWNTLAASHPLDRHPQVLARLRPLIPGRPNRIEQGLASNPTSPPALLRRLAEDTRLAPLVVRNPGFADRDLEALATKPGWAMRQLAAGSERLSPGALARLAQDSDERVRMAVARNPRTPRASLEQLARDQAVIVSERARELLAGG